MYRFPPKRILVGVDFTAESLRAFKAAKEVAAHCGARLDALFCDAFVPPEYSAYYEALRDEARRERIERSLRRRFGDAVLPISRGDPTTAVLSAARRLGADMIVLGTHGRRGLARTLFGSVAEAVLRESPVPVLVVRRGFRAPRRILAPIRADRDAARALTAAALVARSFRARLDVLHVVDDPIFGPNPEMLVGSRLKRLAPLMKGGARMKAEILLGDPVAKILQATHSRDLLVLVERPKSPLGDFVHGTTAERLARLSPIPVLAIPARRRRPTRAPAARTTALFPALTPQTV